MNNTQERPLEGELHQDERLLWTGGPPRGVRFHRYDIFLLPFGLCWTGFAVYCEVSVLTHLRGPLLVFYALWGVPFLLVGFHMVLGRFIVDVVRRRKTFYALTDRRIITIYAGRRRRVTSVILRNFPSVWLEEKGDGSGSIVLGSWHEQGSWFAEMAGPAVGPPRLDIVEDVGDLYELILKVKDAATRARASRTNALTQTPSQAGNTVPALGTELAPEEHLLWIGQPDGRVCLRPRDALAFIVGLMGVVVVLVAAMLPVIFGGPVDPYFSLYLSPFALVATYLSFGRLLVDAHRRRRTCYGLTNERIVIVSGLFRRNVLSARLRSLEAISLTERRNGSGSIAFGPPSAWARRLPAGPGDRALYWVEGFEMLENVRRPYDTILEALW